jgi:hypothetical protein
MSVSTYGSRAHRALLFKQNVTLWIGIGRTTEWSNEALAPDPDPTATTITEPIVYIKASLVSLCVPVSSDEDFIHLGTKYQYIIDDDAIINNARFLYITASFDPSAGQPYGNFRQVGVFSDLVPADGYESESWLEPTHVDSIGILEYLDNDTVTTMAQNRKEQVEIIIEFR